ncbi:ropporin-1-like protein isoform X7 [Narcine bancroftii]|uniref:ropporin-1-like protein isoform X7 n=1 Tax=Narcine bancroftii TaxID=1343680 RepID=UPI00383102E6
MPLPDVMFCAQQIEIPPEFPEILKQFTKAAIRTQPRDVLQWSASYFAALSKGETLPVKERFEMPVATQKNDTGLTPGLLKVLHNQSLFSALKYACEILTTDPPGGAAHIRFETFTYLFAYLAEMDGTFTDSKIEEMLLTLEEDVLLCGIMPIMTSEQSTPQRCLKMLPHLLTFSDKFVLLLQIPASAIACVKR